MHAVAWIILLLVTMAPVSTRAAEGVEFGWDEDGVAVSVQDQPANAVLEVISAATGIPVVLDPANKERLDGLYRKRTLEDLLLDLSPGLVITYRHDPRLNTHVIDRIYSSSRVAAEVKEAQLRDLVVTRERLEQGLQPPTNRTVRYSGIGASIKMADDGAGIYVRPLSPDAPAARAGLALGDLVIAIDGRPVSEFLGTGEVAAAIRGPENSDVTLTVRLPDGRVTTRTVRRQVFTWSPAPNSPP